MVRIFFVSILCLTVAACSSHEAEQPFAGAVTSSSPVTESAPYKPSTSSVSDSPFASAEPTPTALVEKPAQENIENKKALIDTPPSVEREQITPTEPVLEIASPFGDTVTLPHAEAMKEEASIKAQASQPSNLTTNNAPIPEFIDIAIPSPMPASEASIIEKPAAPARTVERPVATQQVDPFAQTQITPPSVEREKTMLSPQPVNTAQEIRSIPITNMDGDAVSAATTQSTQPAAKTISKTYVSASGKTCHVLVTTSGEETTSCINNDGKTETLNLFEGNH